MNKIFKVVWSKTKECYVVVSEVAKNNGGKKKVLASVLAGLAMVGAGAQVQAYSALGGHDNPAIETLAVGPDTWANQEAAVAVGIRNNANGQAGKHSVAIGNFSNANGEISIAMGGVTNASGKMSVAVGYQASATDEAAVALGNMVSADKNSTGVGPGATASGTYAFAGGYQSETTGISGVAIGDNAKAKAARAMAIGGHAEATAEQAIAIGSDTGAGNKTTASKKNAIAVGHGATASGLDTAAIGTSATASGQSSVALGNGTQSTNLNTTAIGSNVQSTKTGSIGIGGNVESIGDYSVAIGSASAGKTVKAVDYATAVGGLSNAAERAAALGAGANAAQARSVALGYRATANIADGVAIGSTSVASTAAGAQGFDSAENRTRKYTNLTGNVQTSTLAAVSVGDGSTATRQITGLAAGKEDTDAVNVAQLKNVGVRVGADTNTATIGTNKVAADFLAYNGQLNIKGDSNRVTTVSENDANGKDANVNVKFDYDGLVKAKTGSAVTVDQKTDAAGKTYFEIDAAAGSKTVVADGKNTTVTGAGTTASPYKVNVEGALTGISSITNNGGGKIEFTTGGTTISGGPVNVSNNKITGVANGDVNATSTDAVNGSQLHAVKAAERHIAPTTTGHEYTVDNNGDVTMTYLDGNNNAVANEKAVIKGIAKNDLSNITNEGKKEITKLGTIVKAGDNVNVSESSDATTGRTTYTVNAVTPAVYTKADGTKVYKRPDGTFTTNSNLAAGNNVDKGDVITSFMDGNGNTTGGNMVINNVGSAIDKTGTSTGNTFLTKLDTAATNTPNAAVNVKDLKNTSDALINKGLNFTGNNDATVNAHKLGSLVKVQGEGVAATDVPSFASAAGNIAVVANGTDTLELKLNKNLKGINSISNGSSSITLNSNPGGTNNTPAVQITGGNLSMGNGTINNKIVNLAPGTNDTDAVNYSQIKGLRTEVKQGANVTVSKTQGTDGHDIYTISAAATGGTASSWNIKSSADTANGGATATGHNANAVNISDQKTVEMVAGKNLTVKQDTTTDGAKVELALSDNIVAGKDGVNGKDGSVGATGKDGSSVVINGADGSIGMTGPKGQDGKDGINGRDGANLSMTSAKGEQVLVNRDPAHSADTDKAERIVYVPKDASGNPIQDANGKNIVREVATMDDGLKFTGNNTTIENKQKLGSLVKVQGEGTKEGTTVINTATGEKEIVLSDGTTKFESAKDNIAVVADGTDTLTVKLNKNLAGINKISNGNSSITLNDTPNATTPAVTITGGNLSMGDSTTKNKIVNLAPGTEDSDAVNYKQLKAAKTEVKAGDNVTVKLTTDTTDGHNIYTINAVTPAVYTKADGTKVVKRPDGTYTTNVDGAPGNDVPASDVIISFQDAAGDTKQGNSIVNNVGSAIDKPGTATGNTFLTKLDKAATDTPFAAVNVRDLKTTADALKATERHIAPTTVPTGSTENKGGTASGGTNVYKYDATSKTVTLTYNDGNGKAVTDTKAVIDFSALNTGGTGASSWNIASDKVSATEGTVAAGSAAAQNIADGKTVTMQAGKNLTVNQTNDAAGNASVAFSLDKDLTNLDKVVVNGKDGIAGKDGVTIVGPQGATGAPGMPGTNGIDGKVGITGKDGKDAVSISGKDGIGTIGLTGPQGPAGQDGRGVDITTDHGTQTLYKPEANNNNQSERIVYVPKDKDGTPLKDTDGNTIKREVATMDDGLKFTGNNTSTENKQKLGSLVKVQGEGTKESTAVDPATGKKYVVLSDGTTKFESAKDNIAVEADGTDTLTVKLNKNLKGLNSIQLGDNTIKSNGDNIEFTTKGGNTKTVATTDQLWTIQANGTDVPAKSGKVNLVAGDHITITPDAANGKMTISATGFGSMDGFNVKSSASTGGTHAGDTTENIKNGKTVDMQAGKNLVVTQTNDGNGNTTVNYALNKDVDLGTTGSLKTGDTTINNDGFKNGNTTVGGNGMTINNPTDPTKTISLTKDGLNNGGNQITNVASGGNVDTNAANIGDIKRLAKDTRIKDGTYTVDNNGTVELTYVDGAGNQVKDASGNAITAKITGLTTLDSTRVNVAVNKTGTGEVAGSTAPVKVTKGTEFVAGNNLIVERKAHTGNDLDNSVVYSLNSNLTGINSISNTATGPKMTFGGNNVNFTGGDVKISNGNLDMNNNKITNVANGTADNDAVNVSQLKAAKTVVKDDGVTTRVTKSTGANGEDVYTVQSLTGGGADLSNITNKVDQLGEEIGRVGAQGAALSALKPIQYDPLEPTQIMAGYGNYRGNSALALGVAHYKNESTLIHGGVSWAGGSSHMMANAGVTWKVGNRDSEAAVADRYRKGPISSAYAMQQEMASVKAQNAGLKSEVSDLKAENEQMKAQIAAMMAKLGM